MKRLLITGGCGFVGHHLVEGVLKNTDWEIVVLDSLTYSGNLKRLTDMDNWDNLFSHRVKFVWHDLRAPISENKGKEIGNVDYVWHLAAESHVDKSLKEPETFVLSNVLGTTNLLNFFRNKEIEKFIYFSTDEVFGPAPEGVYHQEDDTLNPSNPYAATKEGAEAICKAFAFCFGIPVIIARSMNIVGERQHPEKFIPKTIKKIIRNKKITLHGRKGRTSRRCWVHAREVCNALLFLIREREVIKKPAQNDVGYGIFHIVGKEMDVEEIANLLCFTIKGRNLKEEEIEYEDYHSTRPGHDFRYAMDGSKLESAGFEFKIPLRKALMKIVEWTINKQTTHTEDWL